MVESEDECVPDVLVLPSRLKHFSKVSIGVRMCGCWVRLMILPGGRQHDCRQSVVLVQKYLCDVVIRWSRLRFGKGSHDGRYIENLIDVISLVFVDDRAADGGAALIDTNLDAMQCFCLL